MLKPKINKKNTHTILRLPKWKDLAISAALFFISRASVLGGFPMTVPFFAAICDSSAVYIYLPVIILSSMSAGANVIKYFLASSNRHVLPGRSDRLCRNNRKADCEHV